MAQRRGKGDGSLTQRHDHPSCPPVVDKVRPDHPCRGRWVATLDVSAPGQQQRIRKTYYGKTRREAKAKLDRALADRRENRIATGPAMTVESWLTYYLDVICVEQGLKINTLKSHRSKVERYLVPHLGALRLDRLQPEHIRAMNVALEKQGLSKSTIRQNYTILSRALKIALRERKVPYNAATLMDPPKAPKSKRVGLTPADMNKVLASDNLRAHIALHGLRQGEALALRWTDVDLDLGVVDVNRTVVRNPGVGLTFDTPKSERSYRLVPIEGRSLALLKLAWHDRLDDDALVFHNGAGAPRDPRADWQEWTDLLAELGIPHVQLHAARNTFASYLERMKVPQRIISELMGHANEQTTGGYQTADIDQHRDAIRALHGGEAGRVVE